MHTSKLRLHLWRKLKQHAIYKGTVGPLCLTSYLGRFSLASSSLARTHWGRDKKRCYGDCAATSSLTSTGWTYLGYLWSSEVDDLPKLFGMEDRLHSLLWDERQVQRLVSWLLQKSKLSTRVCTLASMRSLRFSTIIGSLVNSSNRYCHSQVSWPNVPLVTKKIPLATKKETSQYTWGLLAGREQNMRWRVAVVCRNQHSFITSVMDRVRDTHRLVIMRMSDSLTFAWAKYLYLA